MEKPKTPETLEAQNSGGKALEEAAGYLDWSESCPGLGEPFSNIFEGNGRSVDFGHNDVGIGTVEVATQVVKLEETMLDGSEGGNLELGVDATMSGVGNSCVNGFGFGSVGVENQMVEPEETVLDGIKRDDLELGVDSAISGVQKSCVNGAGVEEVYMVDAQVDVGDQAQVVSRLFQSENGHDLQNMHEDGGVEKLFEDGKVEKPVEDEGLEKAVDDDDGVYEAKALASSTERDDDRVEKILVGDGKAKVGSNGIDPAVDTDSNKLEVSDNGISLLEDFTGPPPGFIVDIGHRIASKVNAEEFGDDELEKGAGHEDYDFCVGDIVWVKTKIKTWWPGRIHDPLDASKYGMVSDQEGCLLVGYFGMSHVAWCLRYQIKPFAQFFEHISGKSKARIFVGAVEKALEAFGDRVKLNMTCACVLNKNRLSVDDGASKGVVPIPERNCSEIGEFSVTHFDSAKFLADLKTLAQVVSKVSILDFTVAQSQLSAFYRSTGHSQLPMHLLLEGTLPKQTEKNVVHQEKNNENEGFAKVFGGDSAYKSSISSSKVRKRKMKRDSEVEDSSLLLSPTVKEINAFDIGNDDDGIEGMIEIGAESRERKKSRYLSYPYVNLGQKGLCAEGMAATIDGGPPSNFKSTGEKFWKKWYKRFTGVSKISGDSNLKNTSSEELLSEFCSAAINCQHPIENKAFDSVAWFISNFRISVFHDEPICETYSKNMAGQDEDKDAEPCLLENGDQNEGKFEPKKRNKKTVLKNAESEGAGNTSSFVQSPATAVQGMNGNLGKKRGRPKLGKSKTKSIYGMLDVNTSIAADGQMVQNSVALGPLVPCDKPKQKKRGKAGSASQVSLQTKQTIGIPDLNGNSVIPTLLVNDQQTIGHAASEGNVELEKRFGTQPASEHSKSINMAPGLVDANGNTLKPGTLVVDLGIPAPVFPCLGSNQVTGLLSAESKPAPKKRKRKEKKDPRIPVQTDSIPDLNGNGAECLTPASKPERKRRRKGEALATALLLSFAPGVPLPSKDDLISTFCRFGPLKESETQFLKDPSSAQVVFMESADAGEAFQSLEKNNPFGTNLVGYKRFNLPSVSKVMATSLASPPTKRLLSPVQSPAKGPCLDVIKQNLQMMTSMLEKSGDTLSPEMRAKLECEIKGLLQKVSSTDGSSSA